MSKIICSICNKLIVKYSMDINSALNEGATKIKDKYFCWKCSQDISIQVVKR